MNFTDAIAILVTRIFVLAMADCMTHALQRVVTLIFIGIQRSVRMRQAFYKRAKRASLRIVPLTDAYLMRLPTYHRTNRWTILVIRAASTPSVGSSAWWVLWLPMPFPFFPQRSGTFRLLPLPDRSRVLRFVHPPHCPAWHGAQSVLWCDGCPTRGPIWPLTCLAALLG